MLIMSFQDRSIPYDTFLTDVASLVVKMMRDDTNDPEFISQRTAFKLFGRCNVERWRRDGKVKPYKRPGKLEYKTSELRYLQRTEQDYFSSHSKRN